MPAHPFLHALRKHIRRIRKGAGDLSRTCRQKDLHELRVELKRFRALLRLLRSVDPEFPYAKVNQPFKLLFEQAGQLRFWQLQVRLLEKTAGLPALFANRYHTYTHQRLRRERYIFQETAQRDALPRWREMKDFFQTSLKRCNPGTLERYFNSTRESALRIAAHLEKTRPAERHELRKILKEYHLNRQTVSKHFDFDPGPMPGLPADVSLLDIPFGQWHDLQAAGAQLAEDLKTQTWNADVLTGGAYVLRVWKKQERALWQEVRPVLERLH